MSELAKAVLQNNPRVIRELYYYSRSIIYTSLRKKYPKLPEQDMEDFFHETITLILEKIRNGHPLFKNIPLSSEQEINLGGLIRIIMERLILKYLRGNNDQYVNYEEYLDNIEDEGGLDQEREEDYKLVMQAYRQLRPLCQNLISGKIFHGISFKELARELAAESGEKITTDKQLSRRENARRQENYRCLKQLFKNYQALKNKVH